jgi:DNA-binding MarR family transcriptional regulator
MGSMESSTASRLQAELKQDRPFSSVQAEAAIAILRTADDLHRHYGVVIEPYGITGQQYNVLRILRGAHPEPLPTLEIGERLIERVPGITRLLDRLEDKGLVSRERCAVDRRLVHCRISEAGLVLLAEMDDAVSAADRGSMGNLTEAEVETLVALLERVREGTA